MWDYDSEVRQSIGVLDGNTWSDALADEAREIFYTENTFIMQYDGLSTILEHGTTDPRNWKLLCKHDRFRRYSLRGRQTKADLKLRYMLSNFKPGLYIRKLTVQLCLELTESDFIWSQARQANPRKELRTLLQCSKLQTLEITVVIPKGLTPGHGAAKRIVEIWDVIEALHNKFGDKLKGMNHLLDMKTACMDDSDNEYAEDENEDALYEDEDNDIRDYGDDEDD